jgi:hypothetical protein
LTDCEIVECTFRADSLQTANAAQQEEFKRADCAFEPHNRGEGAEPRAADPVTWMCWIQV